jgi:hypothetical protein
MCTGLAWWAVVGIVLCSIGVKMLDLELYILYS